jgi:plastocyanin
MKKLYVIGIVLLVGVVSALMTTSLHATTGGSARTVRTAGGESFVPNGRISANLRFIPGDVQIRSGGTLTFETGDATQEPHTLSIVDASDVPSSIDDVFSCGEPGTVCDAIFTLGGPDFPPQRVIEAPGSMPGLDARLDTLVVLPGESVSAKVTAPSGTTLYFICAIHAWMQGRIVVE